MIFVNTVFDTLLEMEKACFKTAFYFQKSMMLFFSFFIFTFSFT